MIATSQISPIEKLVSTLDEDQQSLINESPRQERLILLAQFLRKTEAETLQIIANLYKIKIIDEFELPADAAKYLPLRIIHEYQCLPFKIDDTENLNLITLWPSDTEIDEWIYAVCGKVPKWHLGLSKTITNCITQNFGVGSDSLSDSDIALDDQAGREVDEEEDENAALIRFVNEVIHKAVTDRATDIHFEPLKESLQIRYRIDGELAPVRLPDNLIRFQGAIISRLKIMAKLNISEKRRPQDGRINYKSASHELDIRISTMPTMYGESVSLRLLNQKNQPLSLTELGLGKAEKKKIERVLELPHGIILVTGPTGSGKSTSLTAYIRTINMPGRRIITIEDPVEYEVPGVNQMQVHSEIGFNFANALRHILRQDPDVIMVGEIRDKETAEIGIRAALTGHLVLSTLHTNDAPGALTRLIDMEIEPFLIASSVELIIAQRLVRRLCNSCKRKMSLDEKYLKDCMSALQIEATSERMKAEVYEANGCEVCRNFGYKGRIGIFELLRMDEDIHEMVVQKQSSRQIRNVAIQNGMNTLQQSGWNQVERGLTTLPEVMRFSKISDEG